MRKMGWLLLLLAGYALQAREVKPLNDGWTFFKGFMQTGPVAGASFGRGPVGEPVTLPHTWNADDFQTEGTYYRGYGTYNRTL